MAGLPKKYAKMGFKRGWAAYKKTKGSGLRKRPTRAKRMVKPMARRRNYRKTVRRARTAGGSMKPIIDGVIVGVASSFLRGKIPYADAITTLGVGYFRNNVTLKTLGAVELGEGLIGGMLGGGSTNNGSSFFEG